MGAQIEIFVVGAPGSIGEGKDEVHVGPTPPDEPFDGQVWVDTTGTGAPAVEAGVGPPGPQGEPGPAGPPGADSTVPGPAGAGYVRTTAGVTTASLAAAASESGTILLANGYRLLRVTTSSAARVRLYTTAAKQAADAARAIGTDPTGDHGLMLEFVSTSGLLAADLSPTVDGFDGKTTPDGAIPITITNTGAGATAVTVTLAWIRTE